MGWVVVVLELLKMGLSICLDIQATKKKAKADLDLKTFWKIVQTRIQIMHNYAIKEAVQAQNVEDQIDKAKG